MPKAKLKVKREYGTGSVYRRGKRWWITYWQNGKQVWESAKTQDEKAAKDLLQIRIGQRSEGRLVVGGNRITGTQILGLLLNDYVKNRRRSLPSVRIQITKHLVPFFGRMKAQQITKSDVDFYSIRRQEEGAKNGTINRELAALKRAFNLALEAEVILKTPKISLLAENNARQGFFERWEYETVLAKLPPYLQPAITFAYLTGWRINSEVLALTWAQVDFEAGTVRLEVGTTKNKEGRLIYMMPELRAVLETQWKSHLAEVQACPWVFPYRGKRLFSTKKAWKRACLAAGLVGKIPHDFRRTAVRNMVRAGIPERVAMQMAGHKTRSVFDRYHIVSEGDLREAAQKLARLATPQVGILGANNDKTMTGGQIWEKEAQLNA